MKSRLYQIKLSIERQFELVRALENISEGVNYSDGRAAFSLGKNSRVYVSSEMSNETAAFNVLIENLRGNKFRAVHSIIRKFRGNVSWSRLEFIYKLAFVIL